MMLMTILIFADDANNSSRIHIRRLQLKLPLAHFWPARNPGYQIPEPGTHQKFQGRSEEVSLQVLLPAGYSGAVPKEIQRRDRGALLGRDVSSVLVW